MWRVKGEYSINTDIREKPHREKYSVALAVVYSLLSLALSFKYLRQISNPIFYIGSSGSSGTTTHTISHLYQKADHFTTKVACITRFLCWSHISSTFFPFSSSSLLLRRLLLAFFLERPPSYKLPSQAPPLKIHK